jgi:hypothetical protein
MDESQFRKLARRAKALKSEYGRGYFLGINRHFYGEKFGDEGVHETLMTKDSDSGRGYRDGFSGREPEPPIGRPSVDDSEFMVPVTIRMTPVQRDKFKRLGGGAWLRGVINEVEE